MTPRAPTNVEIVEALGSVRSTIEQLAQHITLLTDEVRMLRGRPRPGQGCEVPTSFSSLSQAARFAGVKRHTLKRWLAAEAILLPRVEHGGKTLIRKGDVERVIKKRLATEDWSHLRRMREVRTMPKRKVRE